ncbi:hypothetical protein CSUI_005831 [Cystoisospora suis]|uniref:Transmembrane protein n=1 Tax=Cystoisospora suis TaxID=483139 RepID=A0A2C6KVQ0_9APIC|nr:hypothetical protein CSUI_005831 [Cystoisospora suis]
MMRRTLTTRSVSLHRLSFFLLSLAFLLSLFSSFLCLQVHSQAVFFSSNPSKDVFEDQEQGQDGKRQGTQPFLSSHLETEKDAEGWTSSERKDKEDDELHGEDTVKASSSSSSSIRGALGKIEEVQEEEGKEGEEEERPRSSHALPSQKKTGRRHSRGPYAPPRASPSSVKQDYTLAQPFNLETSEDQDEEGSAMYASAGRRRSFSDISTRTTSRRRRGGVRRGRTPSQSSGLLAYSLFFVSLVGAAVTTFRLLEERKKILARQKERRRDEGFRREREGEEEKREADVLLEKREMPLRDGEKTEEEALRRELGEENKKVMKGEEEDDREDVEGEEESSAGIRLMKMKKRLGGSLTERGMSLVSLLTSLFTYYVKHPSDLVSTMGSRAADVMEFSADAFTRLLALLESHGYDKLGDLLTELPLRTSQEFFRLTSLLSANISSTFTPVFLRLVMGTGEEEEDRDRKSSERGKKGYVDKKKNATAAGGGEMKKEKTEEERRQHLLGVLLLPLKKKRRRRSSKPGRRESYYSPGMSPPFLIQSEVS